MTYKYAVCANGISVGVMSLVTSGVVPNSEKGQFAWSKEYARQRIELLHIMSRYIQTPEDVKVYKNQIGYLRRSDIPKSEFAHLTTIVKNKAMTTHVDGKEAA